MSPGGNTFTANQIESNQLIARIAKEGTNMDMGFHFGRDDDERNNNTKGRHPLPLGFDCPAIYARQLDPHQFLPTFDRIDLQIENTYRFKFLLPSDLSGKRGDLVVDALSTRLAHRGFFIAIRHIRYIKKMKGRKVTQTVLSIDFSVNSYYAINLYFLDVIDVFCVKTLDIYTCGQKFSVEYVDDQPSRIHKYGLDTKFGFLPFYGDPIMFSLP
jgi:hypothetical protein